MEGTILTADPVIQGRKVAKSVRELEIFIASPGDVAAERQAVRDTVDSVNHLFASHSNFPRLLATGWEDLPPTYGRPQGRINELVASCDVFVGVLGNRFGSPTGTHPSGFLEEYEGAVERRGRDRSPEVALYFRTPTQDMLADPGTELQRVLRFKRQVEENHEVLYGEFKTDSEFRDQLKDLLTKVVLDNIETQSQPDKPGNGQLVPAVTPDQEIDESQVQTVATLTAFANIVRGTTVVQADLDADRLLQFALLFQGSDAHIPVHAGNRLFLKRMKIVLAIGERRLWLRTMIRQERTDKENIVVPGWYFASAGGKQAWNEFASAVSRLLSERDAELTNGALRALTRSALRPESLWSADNGLDSSIEYWQQSLSPYSDPVELASYLIAVYVPDDEALLSRLAEGSDNHREVFAAVLASKTNNREYINGLVEERNFNTLKWPKIIVRSHLELLDKTRLKEIISWSEDPTLRGRIFDMLLASCDLDAADWVAALSGPPNEDLLKQMCAAARSLSPEVRSSLTEAIEASSPPNHLEILGALKFDDVQGCPPEATADVSVWDALSWTGHPSLLPHARHVLSSGGREYVEVLEGAQGITEELVDFVQGKARWAALRVIQLAGVSDSRSSDARQVVEELAKNHWITSGPALDALLAVGEHDDIQAVIGDAVAHPYSESGIKRLGAALLIAGNDTARELVGHADARVSLTATRYLSGLASLDVKELVGILFSEHAKSRLEALEGIIRRSSRSELENLLESYPTMGTGGSYFYNIVARLDDYLYGPENALPR